MEGLTKADNLILLTNNFTYTIMIGFFCNTFYYNNYILLMQCECYIYKYTVA